MKNQFLVVAAFLSLGSPVLAGEYVAKADRWSGCYGGASVGYMGGQTKFDSLGLNNFRVGVSTVASDPSNLSRQTEKFAPGGFLGGLHLGCSQQINNFVVGLEFDGAYSFADHKRKTVDITGFPPIFYTSKYGSNSWKQNGVVNMRLRGGYVVGNFLPFITLGVAGVSQVRTTKSTIISQSIFFDPRILDSQKQTSNKVDFGFSFGAGLEYAFSDHWSAKVEYTGIILPKSEFTTYDFFGYPLPVKTSSIIHSARVGASYKF